MFELWRQAEVCEHSGPAEDSNGLPITLPARARLESDRLLEYWLDRAQAGTGFRWAVLLAPKSTFIGAVGFNQLGARPEYAYHFDPRYWGTGLATEASRLALAMCFALGAEAVEAYISPENRRSIRLAERLGFSEVEAAPRKPSRFVIDRLAEQAASS